MEKWEYAFMEGTTKNARVLGTEIQGSAPEVANKLGQEGWDLVKLEALPQIPSAHLVAVFRRTLGAG